MVSVWATDATADSITLSDGRVLTSDDISGNGWNANRLGKARDKLQQLLDYHMLAADIPPDEETLGWSGAEMQAVYGGRMWYDNGDLVSRSVVVDAVLWDGAKLSLALSNP